MSIHINKLNLIQICNANIRNNKKEAIRDGMKKYPFIKEYIEALGLESALEKENKLESSENIKSKAAAMEKENKLESSENIKSKAAAMKKENKLEWTEDLKSKASAIVHHAVCMNKLSLLEYLLNIEVDEKCPTFNKRDSKGRTPVYYAIELERHDHLDLLFRTERIEVNQQDSLGNTLLHYAVFHANQVAVDALIKQGASINKRDGKGLTPVHYAIELKHHDLLDLFFRTERIEVNRKDSVGNTLLHYAVFHANWVAMDTLIKYGASIYIQNNANLTALDLASNFLTRPPYEERLEIFNDLCELEKQELAYIDY